MASKTSALATIAVSGSGKNDGRTSAIHLGQRSMLRLNGATDVAFSPVVHLGDAQDLFK